MSDENTIVEDQSSEQLETVSKKAYEEVKNDMIRYKQEFKTLQDELSEYKSQLEKANESRLAEKQEFKTLYEQTKQKYEQQVQENQKLYGAFETNEKMQAIRQAAIKAGIRDEALDDLDLMDTSGVIVERTDQGRINIIGANDFVENLKTRKSFWFQSTQPPKVNTGTGGGSRGDTKLSPQEILKLEKEKPDEYRKYMAGRLRKA